MPSKAQILVSRSFPDPIHDPEIVGAAVVKFAQRASRQLRKEGEVAGRCTVFATTSPHRPGPGHNVSARIRLAVPANEPGPLVAAARAALVPKLMHGMQYMCAGILCMDLAPDGAVPVLPGVLEQPAPVGELIDAVNRRFGTGTLALGRLGTHSPTPRTNRQTDPSPGTPPPGTNNAPSADKDWEEAAAHFLGPEGPPKRLPRRSREHLRV